MKMKKYLMTGIAALALCAGFTSCSHDLESYTPEQIKEQEAKKIVDNYNQAFLNYVGGTISPNQDWGFGTTRTRTENANANEWADPTKEYGGLKVPPPLTEAQYKVVKKYFQTHPNLGYMDPHWTNYFIQQVYKGDPETAGEYSPEQYKSAAWTQSNQTYIMASDKMNHLVAVDAENGIVDHINNFNHGDCSENTNVLTWSPDYVSVEGQTPVHTDKIMYMKNSTTKSFGYYNSDGSLYHTQHTGLVSYAKIIEDMGAEANCLDDGWERSFMGFDFEQIVGDDVYSKNYDLDYDAGYKQPYEYEDGVEYYNGFKVKGITYNTWKFDADGDGVEEEYNFLIANTNMYAADRSEKTFDSDGGVAHFPGALPTDAEKRLLLSKGYLPYTDSFRDWVKVGGTADRYYSDWIVTLTEAKTANDDPNSIRVMAEDLNATGDDDSDFDFNDIVFDVFFDKNNTGKTNVVIKAAGGTLPLRIAKVQTPSDTNDADWAEVHDLFSKANGNMDCAGKMINTNGTQSAQANVRNRSIDGLTEPTHELQWSVTTPAGAKDIKIQVYKNESWITIDATKGGPAAKFACKTSYQWMNERVSIKTEVQSFADWCAGKSDLYWPK